MEVWYARRGRRVRASTRWTSRRRRRPRRPLARGRRWGWWRRQWRWQRRWWWGGPHPRAGPARRTAARGPPTGRLQEGSRKGPGKVQERAAWSAHGSPAGRVREGSEKGPARRAGVGRSPRLATVVDRRLDALVRAAAPMRRCGEMWGDVGRCGEGWTRSYWRRSIARRPSCRRRRRRRRRCARTRCVCWSRVGAAPRLARAGAGRRGRGCGRKRRPSASRAARRSTRRRSGGR